MDNLNSSENVLSNTKEAPGFPFMRLPRELREEIYDHIFRIPDPRSDRSLRIERRHLKYFTPSAPTILLTLHHESLLINQQICREALEVLFKKHTLFLSCGPYVLERLLSKMEAANGPPKQWLKWIKSIELDWVTFPNLRVYPPERSEGRDEWWWERDREYTDGYEIDVDYIRGAQYNAHYDEHDYEGGNGYYDDNIYGADEPSLYPNWPRNNNRIDDSDSDPNTNPNDPFSLSTHYPFGDPTPTSTTDTLNPSTLDEKLHLLISLEVSPLFTLLSTPTSFPSLTTLTLPLYFLSKQSLHSRNATARSAHHCLPVKLRYWVHVLVHALRVLARADTPLSTVRVKYLPWDVWASMDPADDLARVVERGVWFGGGADEGGAGAAANHPHVVDDREGECEAFKMAWHVLGETQDSDHSNDSQSQSQSQSETEKMEKLARNAEIRFVKWDGELDGRRVGDELEVVFTAAS